MRISSVKMQSDDESGLVVTTLKLSAENAGEMIYLTQLEHDTREEMLLREPVGEVAPAFEAQRKRDEKWVEGKQPVLPLTDDEIQSVRSIIKNLPEILWGKVPVDKTPPAATGGEQPQSESNPG